MDILSFALGALCWSGLDYLIFRPVSFWLGTRILRDRVRIVDSKNGFVKPRKGEILLAVTISQPEGSAQ